MSLLLGSTLISNSGTNRCSKAQIYKEVIPGLETKTKFSQCVCGGGIYSHFVTCRKSNGVLESFNTIAFVELMLKHI